MSYLFRGIEGFRYFSRKKERLKEEIGFLTNSELASSDESLKIILKAQNTIEPITFQQDYSTDNGEIRVNIRSDPRFIAYLFSEEDSRPSYKKARQLLVHIPFSGNIELFNIQPSTISFGGYPEAEIENGELLFTVVLQ